MIVGNDFTVLLGLDDAIMEGVDNRIRTEQT